MLDILLPIIIGGLIGISGSVIQSIINSKNTNGLKHVEQREDSYLKLIDAVLEVEAVFQVDEVHAHNFYKLYDSVEAKLCMYGSNDIIERARSFYWELEDCIDNHWIKGIESSKSDLIDAIRKELRIKK